MRQVFTLIIVSAVAVLSAQGLFAQTQGFSGNMLGGGGGGGGGMGGSFGGGGGGMSGGMGSSGMGMGSGMGSSSTGGLTMLSASSLSGGFGQLGFGAMNGFGSSTGGSSMYGGRAYGAVTQAGGGAQTSGGGRSGGTGGSTSSGGGGGGAAAGATNRRRGGRRRARRRRNNRPGSSRGLKSVSRPPHRSCRPSLQPWPPRSAPTSPIAVSAACKLPLRGARQFFAASSLLPTIAFLRNRLPCSNRRFPPCATT